MPTPPRATLDNPYGPSVTFRTEDTLPPGSVYVGPEDAIVFNGTALGQTANITVTLRRLMPDGTVDVSQDSFQMLPNLLTPFAYTIPPAEGWLLSLRVTGDPVSRGLCFLKCFLRFNVGGTDAALGQTICQGYVDQYDDLAYPPGTIEPSLSGRGGSVFVQAPTPLPGQDYLFTVPNNTVWRVQAIAAGFTCSAQVATRTPQLILEGPSSQGFFITLPNISLTASGVATINWFPNAELADAATFHSQPLPDNLVLYPGWRIVTSTGGIQTGDQWNALNMAMEQWVG